MKTKNFVKTSFFKTQKLNFLFLKVLCFPKKLIIIFLKPNCNFKNLQKKNYKFLQTNKKSHTYTI